MRALGTNAQCSLCSTARGDIPTTPWSLAMYIQIICRIYETLLMRNQKRCDLNPGPPDSNSAALPSEQPRIGLPSS